MCVLSDHQNPALVDQVRAPESTVAFLRAQVARFQKQGELAFDAG